MSELVSDALRCVGIWLGASVVLAVLVAKPWTKWKKKEEKR